MQVGQGASLLSGFNPKDLQKGGQQQQVNFSDLNYKKTSIEAQYGDSTLNVEMETLNFKSATIGFGKDNQAMQDILSQITERFNSNAGGMFGSVGDLFKQDETFDYNKIDSLLKGIDYEAIGYEGKAITDMTQQEAKDIISEDGFFGVAKTSERVANFVLSGAGDNLEKLQAGREGVLRGFNEAESLWGGKLPDIAYETQEKSLKMIDDRIKELGGNILDSEA
ncbi:MAG: hypothetical protein ACLFQJ_04345 [Campylobacterales bacterium]